MTEQNYHFHVKGMHCRSCVLLIEREVALVSGVKKVRADLSHFSVDVSGDFGDKTPEAVAEELSSAVAKNGYSFSVEKPAQEKEKSQREFWLALPFAFAFLALFWLLQKLGLVNLISPGKMSYGAIFLIGVIASLSSCMAVVGGLLLSMSATFAKEGDTIKPQALFHIGRFLSFFILGGMIGALGAVFQLHALVVAAIGFIVGAVMLLLGFNLLDVFHFTKRFQPSMPKFLSGHAFRLSELNHEVTPFLVGIATFFLPCGFTQSMQIYALSSGNFFSGAFTMFVFALGTFPVLAALSFSSWNIQKNQNSGIFFKTAGLVVISFAFFNIINSLVIIGIIQPVFNF